MSTKIITQDRLKELLNYDPETGVFTRRVATNNRAKVGSVAGCVNRGYVLIKIDGVTCRAHRLAFLYMLGFFPAQVDHINHIRDDNKWANLRAVTTLENQRNRSMQANNPSGVTGVAWHPQAKKWYARIKVQGRNTHLGLFKCITAAALARKAAEAKYGFHTNHGT